MMWKPELRKVLLRGLDSIQCIGILEFDTRIEQIQAFGDASLPV